ncbi:transmembrane protein 2-like, partial [Elysia marginata]
MASRPSEANCTVSTPLPVSFIKESYHLPRLFPGSWLTIGISCSATVKAKHSIGAWSRLGGLFLNFMPGAAGHIRPAVSSRGSSWLTLYKNMDRNTWVRCGNIVLLNSSFADSPASYVAAHTMDDTYCDVRNSIFIGETDNKGEPLTYTFSSQKFPNLAKQDRPKHQFDRSIASGHPDFMISGVQLYQGPVYLHDCYFDRFHTWYYNDSFVDTWGFRPVRPAAAITFHPNNHYPMVPRNGVSGLKFGFCDGVENSFRVMDGNASTPWWHVMDGTGNVMFRDYDGSLTGTKNTQIVQDRPFFTGARCLKKPDWGLAVCPYKYFWLVLRGKTGALNNKYKGKTPVLIRRDDFPNDVYAQTGKTSHKYNLRVFKSYTVFFNATVAPAPRDIQFRPRYGLEKNEIVRFAVCFPKSTTNFTIYSKFPELHPKKKLLPKWVRSLKMLDRDRTMKAFYWDKPNG